MKINFQTAVNRLREMEDVLILIHHFPDGDTIGGGYALCRCLQHMGKRAMVKCENSIPKRYEYITKSVEVQEFEPESIVAVDVADFMLLGEEFTCYEGKIDLCIDHHASNTLYAKETFVNSSAAAACEIIYDIINELAGSIDFDMANALYTGIATDTGCFNFSNTTSKTHIIAANLIDLGIDYAEINRIMFDTKTKSRIKLERYALENMVFFCDDRCAMITITRQFQELSGAVDDDLEGITALPRQVEGVVMGITIRERENNKYKISVRTHNPVDASSFCAAFGGGGHLRAGGCEIIGDLDIVKSMLIKKAQEVLEHNTL